MLSIPASPQFGKLSQPCCRTFVITNNHVLYKKHISLFPRCPAATMQLVATEIC